MIDTGRYLIGAAGVSGFGSKSTADEVTENCDLRSVTAIVTGDFSFFFFCFPVTRVVGNISHILLMIWWRCDVGDRSGDGESAGETRSEVDISGEERESGGGSEREDRLWVSGDGDRSHGAWSQLYVFSAELRRRFRISQSTSQPSYVRLKLRFKTIIFSLLSLC